MKALQRGLRTLGAALALAAAPAFAGYFQWDLVELPASSGAACGNGTPYRFFVNRTLFNQDLVVMYEGGGACWDQRACEGQGRLAASNANGVPVDYLNQFNTAAWGLVTPFTSRVNPFQSNRVQGWNMVYLPYCTGDVHAGNKVRVYSDANPAAPRTQFHRGQRNVEAAAQWLRANLGRPANLMLTGFSAGGTGATATYTLMRDTLAPTGRASLLADSGPLVPAPRTGSDTEYPSLRLHNRIRDAWGLDEPQGMVTRFATLPGFNPDDLGTVNGALAQRYPQDRFAYSVFLADGTYSAFSYEKFYPEISGAPDEASRQQQLYGRWWPDLGRWLGTVATQPNVAWHVPFFRNFNSSHCLTIVDFSGTGIEDLGIADLTPFIDNTLDRGPPMRNVESDWLPDLSRPVSFALQLLAIVQGLFG